MSINVLQELTRQQCFQLLAKQNFGRLAFVAKVGVMPQITPVNYLFDRGAVVFRSDPGSKLTGAIRGAAVAFEVDGIDDGKRTGWSVVVSGHATEVTVTAELDRLRETRFVSWAPGEKANFVRVSPGQVTGRRITLAEAPSRWFG